MANFGKKNMKSFEEALKLPQQLDQPGCSGFKAKKKRKIHEFQDDLPHTTVKQEHVEEENTTAAKLQNVLNRLNKLRHPSGSGAIKPAAASCSSALHHSELSETVSSGISQRSLPIKKRYSSSPVKSEVNVSASASSASDIDLVTQALSFEANETGKTAPEKHVTEGVKQKQKKHKKDKSADKLQRKHKSFEKERKKLPTSTKSAGNEFANSSEPLPPDANIRKKIKRKSTKKLAGQESDDAGGEHDGKIKKKPTAYNLWIKSNRKVVMAKHPELSFAEVSRMMGDMWHSMTKHNKLTWVKQAKSKKAGSKLISTGTGKGVAGRQQGSEVESAKQRAAMRRPGLERLANHVAVMDVEPLDLAAYLKLLGESMTRIGKRLLEKQNTDVQGTVPLLLDSAMCALGPLTCLLSQHPVAGSDVSRVNMNRILDGMAHFMPGI